MEQGWVIVLCVLAALACLYGGKKLEDVIARRRDCRRWEVERTRAEKEAERAEREAELEKARIGALIEKECDKYGVGSSHAYDHYQQHH